jgi:hypothetical protein
LKIRGILNFHHRKDNNFPGKMFDALIELSDPAAKDVPALYRLCPQYREAWNNGGNGKSGQPIDNQYPSNSPFMVQILNIS